MEINSALFILVFLPVVLALCNFVQVHFDNRYRCFLLIGVSVLFYYLNCKEFIVFFIISTIINYGISQVMIRYKQSSISKLMVVLGVIVNICELVYFKYMNMITDTSNLLFGTSFSAKSLMMPLGISFICFQQISYLVDVYKDYTSSYGFLDYMSFISFFPHLTAGPIVQTKDWAQFEMGRYCKFDYSRVAQGIFMFSLGLGKKILIADVFGQAVNWCYSNLENINSSDALFISLAYTLQIYYDFSGYCDMAIGIAKMLQLDLPINFNSPYKAITIIEFWKRWHMTLTSFFTKYLYIPLGGNRKGKFRMILNTMIVFTVSGLWHGASYTFVAWGVLHGLLMVISKQFKRQIDMIPKIFNWIFTFVCVDFAWILFRANSFSVFKKYMQAMFKLDFGPLSEGVTAPFVLLKDIPIIANVPQWIWCISFTLVIMIATLFMDNVNEMSQKLKGKTISAIAIVAIAFISLVSMSGITTFVYQLF